MGNKATTSSNPKLAERQSAPEIKADLAITIDVDPRKPRLVWQGMERKELAAPVPSQVVEIVRPGRAIEREGELDLTTRAAPRDEFTRPENRLIWTNDNLVALQTLLDERELATKEYKYRGKVDLVYIDPPFMVNNDFRADNSIDIELDEKAHVQARKEPSLVEIIAYKDTWRQGLDSFLSMLRSRLNLLKQLLSAKGSIYVHLDWHAVHYVKVFMDELFGYENFVAQIDWKRASAHGNASASFASIVDHILVYRMSELSYWNPLFDPLSASLVASHYGNIDGRTKRRYALRDLTASMSRASESQIYEWRGMRPKPSRCWAYTKENMDKLFAEGHIHFEPGSMPRLKIYLDKADGNPVSNLWLDIPPVNSQALERLGYPTQKPVALIEKIISASCPPDGLVLDCFVGSGTTSEAAERLKRRWIGIDNGKYAVHLTRKRLIQLHGQPRVPEKPQHDYIECKHCKNVERKEKPQRSPGPYQVRPFTIENMGVYQRASEWQGFQQHRTAYRDEMIKVFGGEPVEHSPLLHGRKGNSWVHVGPLDAPVSSMQVWSIAREAQHTSTKSVTILSADFDTLSGSDKAEIRGKTGVAITIRVIPASAIDEVRRRLDILRANPDLAVESTAIPAFYAPLSIILEASVSGRSVEVRVQRCEVDIESFIASQRPTLPPITEKMTDKAKKKALEEIKRWEKREHELKGWLDKAKSWQAFVDFWAVDWDYGSHLGEDGKPIFLTEWQSFRSMADDGGPELTFSAKFSYSQAGRYRVAARVTDVFGNDGIATVEVEVKK